MADRLERCGLCRRPFRGSSKPHWVFTPEAKPLGLMHKGCAEQANRQRPGTDSRVATEREAQLIAWTDLVDDSDKMRELAIVMSWAVHPSLEPGRLSENQERWIERQPAERQAAIRAAYDELVREFREWERMHG